MPTREFAIRQAAKRIPAGALRARAADAARRGRRQLALLLPPARRGDRRLPDSSPSASAGSPD
jgi:hypothetical protein